MSSKISYSQYGEDIILSALLEHVKKGFYVDIGANYEQEDSVTKFFYSNGWTGVNVEPVPKLYATLEKKRPNDINLNVGISSSGKTLSFREYNMHGHSTFSQETMKEHEGLPYTDYKVKTQTLASLFEQHDISIIHFLKIDVEGFEFEVVQSNDWKRYRPYVVCIEANHINKDWRPLVKQANYRLFIQDGLNEYYIALEHWDTLTTDFAERAVKTRSEFITFHHYELLRNYKNEVKRLNKDLNDSIAREKETEKTVAELSATSYKGRPLRSRVKVALYSIFVDWVRVKTQ